MFYNVPLIVVFTFWVESTSHIDCLQVQHSDVLLIDDQYTVLDWNYALFILYKKKKLSVIYFKKVKYSNNYPLLS